MLFPEPFSETLSQTLGALVFVTPISSIFFNSVSVISPITNIIVTPFAPILTVLYILYLITSRLGIEVIGSLIDIILGILFYIIKILSDSEIAELYFPKYLMIIFLIVIMSIYFIRIIKHNKNQKLELFR